MGLVTSSGHMTHVTQHLKPPVNCFRISFHHQQADHEKKTQIPIPMSKPNYCPEMVIKTSGKDLFFISVFPWFIEFVGCQQLVPSWQLQTTNAAPGLHWMERNSVASRFYHHRWAPHQVGSRYFPYITSVWKLSVNTFTVLPIRWIVCYIPTFTYIYYRKH